MIIVVVNGNEGKAREKFETKTEQLTSITDLFVLVTF